MPRAVGIVRVSQVKGREEEEGFASPGVQRDRIADLCQREGLTLAATHEELDVSGSLALDRRPRLLAAVETIEAGEADVLVVAYFDRLVRSLTVQGEVVRRVEAAGGRVLAADIGEVSHGTAAMWLSSTMLGAVAEYHNRMTAEKVREAQIRAVANGIPPIILPPGLRRVGNQLELDEHAPTVAEAVRMRADGATVQEVRDFLRRRGIDRSYHGTISLLGSRLLVGEIVFGTLRGTCPAVVDRETWERAQAVVVPRGRKPKSDRLLARLGVLRCGTCDSRMVVGTSHHSRYFVYRCPPTGDCQRRVTIAAEPVERLVVDRVREALADLEGRASADDKVRAATVALERAQDALDAAIRAFAVVADEPVALEKLQALRDARDRARDDLAHLGGDLRPAVTVTAAADWDRFTLDERRALIRAVVAKVTVDPGRGADRVRVQLFGEDAAGGTV